MIGGYDQFHMIELQTIPLVPQQIGRSLVHYRY